MNKINNYQIQKQLFNLIIKRNYSILTKQNIELAKARRENVVKSERYTPTHILTPPQTQPKAKEVLSSIQFRLEENEEEMNQPYNNQIADYDHRRIVSTDDIINDPSSIEYLFRLDSEEEIKKHEINSKKKDKTSLEMAEEYIYRLLIDETKKDANEDEFLFQQITELPEWNDYNDHIHRELKKLEIEELANPHVDNNRLTEYYEKERIRRVGEIRKIHLIPVRDAIYKRYKELDKELDVVIERKILITMKKTGLSRDELKEHKDYAYLFDENYDSKDELFKEKDDLDIVLESINGPSDSIPSIIKSVVASSKQNFEKEMKIKQKKLYLAASNQSQSNNNQEEEIMVSASNNQSQKYQYKQQQKQQQEPDQLNNVYSNNQQKLSFNDIINNKSYKSQQEYQKQQNNQEEFDLKSILQNMSKKV